MVGNGDDVVCEVVESAEVEVRSASDLMVVLQLKGTGKYNSPLEAISRLTV
jgi:hypothetical protein